MSTVRDVQPLTEEMLVYNAVTLADGSAPGTVGKTVGATMKRFPGGGQLKDAQLVRLEDGEPQQLEVGQLDWTADNAVFEGVDTNYVLRGNGEASTQDPTERLAVAANDFGISDVVDASQAAATAPSDPPLAPTDPDTPQEVGGEPESLSIARIASALAPHHAVSRQSKRPRMLRPDLTAIPAKLKELDRYMLWQWTLRKGTWGKVPFQTRHPSRPAKSNDPRTWATFDETADALKLADENTGFGIALGGTLHGIDLDDVRDSVTGDLNPFAQEVLSRVAGYAEVSPSGTGIKIFCTTNLTSSYTDHSRGLEMYVHGRYFAVTGHALPGREAWTDEVQDVSWLTGDRVERAVSGGSVSRTNDDSDIELLKPPLPGWTLDRIRNELVPSLDIEAPYEAAGLEESYMGTGMAIHHQTRGSDEGREFWDEIYCSSNKFQPGYSESKWASFGQLARNQTTLATLIKIVNDKKAVAERSEFAKRFLSEEDFGNRPPPSWLVHEVMQGDGITIIYGPPSAGKSAIALQLGYAVARGTPWCGCDVEQGSVLYLAAESFGGLQRRVAAYKKHQGYSGSPPIRFAGDVVNLYDRASVDKLIGVLPELLDEGRFALTIVDTLHAAAPGLGENEAKEMGIVIENVKRIEAATGGAFVLLHHSGKDESRGMRGSNSLPAAADTILQVSRVTPTGQERQVRIEKLKEADDAAQPAFGFTFEGVDLGVDSKGRPISSVVAVEAKVKQTLKPPTAKNQLALLEKLRQLGKSATEAELLAAMPATWGGKATGQRNRTLRESLSALATTGHVFQDGDTYHAFGDEDQLMH